MPEMEILSGVHVIPGTRLSRVYLIADKELILVDGGLPWNFGAVLKYVRAIGRRPEELSLVLVTHSHPDHTGSVLRVSKSTGAKVVAHASDTKALTGCGATLSYMGVFSSLRAPIPFLQRTLVSHTLAGDELLDAAGGIRVIHTPGHTPGSVCYLLEKKGVLFSGDILFSNGKQLSRSVPFPGSNKDDYRRSLSRLASMEFEVLCGGHGKPLVRGAADRLRELLAARPDPPSWGGLLRAALRRFYRTGRMGDEEA